MISHLFNSFDDSFGVTDVYWKGFDVTHILHLCEELWNVIVQFLATYHSANAQYEV